MSSGVGRAQSGTHRMKGTELQLRAHGPQGGSQEISLGQEEIKGSGQKWVWAAASAFSGTEGEELANTGREAVGQGSGETLPWEGKTGTNWKPKRGSPPEVTVHLGGGDHKQAVAPTLPRHRSRITGWTGQAKPRVARYLGVPLWKSCLGPACTCPEASSGPWRLPFRPRQWGRTAAVLRGWQ